MPLIRCSMQLDFCAHDDAHKALEPLHEAKVRGRALRQAGYSEAEERSMMQGSAPTPYVLGHRLPLTHAGGATVCHEGDAESRGYRRVGRVVMSRQQAGAGDAAGSGHLLGSNLALDL